MMLSVCSYSLLRNMYVRVCVCVCRESSVVCAIYELQLIGLSAVIFHSCFRSLDETELMAFTCRRKGRITRQVFNLTSCV